MGTTSPKTPALSSEQIRRAADYVELVWQEQGSEEEKAALAEFHADGPELARPSGEFGPLLLADYLTVVPDEHTDCESAYVAGQLVAVASRYVKRWCHSYGGAQAACTTAGFLIQCLQETDQVHQFLTDIRDNTRMRRRWLRSRSTSPGVRSAISGTAGVSRAADIPCCPAVSRTPG